MEFKNVSGSAQELPTLDLRVPDGATFTATGDDAKSLLTNPAFERVDKPTGKTTEKE